MKTAVQLTLTIAVLVCGLSAGTAEAQAIPTKFPLTKAIPDDVFIAVAAKGNPERAFLDTYWEGVTQAFLDSGIMEDVWEMITERIPDDKIDQVEDAREKMQALVEKIEWGELFGQEMIYAGRFSDSLQFGSPYEGVILCRTGKKTAVADYKDLKELLSGLADVIEAQAGEEVFKLTDTTIDGAKMTMFGPEPMPQMIGVGYKDDLVIFSLFNRSILQDAVALLKGEGNKKRLVDNKRFQAAFKALPPAEDSLVFFDFSGMMEKIGAMVKGLALQQMPTSSTSQPGEKGEPDGMEPVRAVYKIIEDMAIIDYAATVEWTDGYRVFTDDVAALKPGAESNPVYRIFKGGAPIAKFDRFVPKQATDFSCGTGINFVELYRYVIDILQRISPDAKQEIAAFKQQLKEEWQLDIEKDVLGLIEGNYTIVSGGQDWAILLKVTSDENAAAQLARLLETVGNALGEEGGLMLTPIEVAKYKGFTQITHPMFMMFGGAAPVAGVAEGHLILGSSSNMVAKCLATGAGKRPSIKENQRWKDEALMPKAGPINSISFTDESKSAEEMQAVISVLSMGLGFATLAGGDMPPEVRGILSDITPILAKLGPVVGKMNFYKSSASYTTFDGKMWYTRKVQNYKSPKELAPGDEDEDDEAQNAAAQRSEPKARATAKAHARDGGAARTRAPRASE